MRCSPVGRDFQLSRTRALENETGAKSNSPAATAGLHVPEPAGKSLQRELVDDLHDLS
jgi:hypothetical protein